MKIEFYPCLKIGACAAVLWTAFAVPVIAAPAEVIKAGDHVEMHYTCKLNNGEIVATTEQSVADDASLKKSNIFFLAGDGKGIHDIAGRVDPEFPPPPEPRDFEKAIETQLAQVVVGMKHGKHLNVEIKPILITRTSSKEHFLKIARVRTRPKEMRLDIDEYKKKEGKAPEVGDVFSFDPGFPGKIVSVTESEAIAKFLPPPSGQVDTPFGKGRIKENKDNYEVVIDAQKGSLVKTGPLVGRIAEIGEASIQIDYGVPFDSEPLVFDLDVKLDASSQQDGKGDKETGPL